MESHDVGRKHELALLAQVEDGVLGEKVRHNLIAIRKNHFASNLASLSSVGILSCIEKWEKVEFPSHLTSLLHNVRLLFELNTIVELSAVHPEFVFCGESYTTLRAGHLESGLKSDVFVIVDLHLPSVVLAVLLLPQLVLDSLAMLLQLILAHKTLEARTALELALALKLVIRAE